MSRYVVRVAAPAREQAAEIGRWWRENREAAPDLFEDELVHALALLADHPEASPLYSKRRGHVVRRIRLEKTRYAVYFTVEPEAVNVIAVWHTSRGSGPPLR